MNIQPIIKDSSTGFRLFLILSLLLFGALFGMLSGLAILYFTEGIDLQASGAIIAEGSNISALRIMQISSAIGLFIVPPFLYSWLVNKHTLPALGFKSIHPARILFPAIVLIFACLPFIHLLTELNQAIILPEWLKNIELWMQQKEADTQRLTELLLNVTSFNGLLINLFMVALLPALGEELVFRAALQPLFGKLFKNMHVGIIVAAFLFSAMHLQFYGLIPRFALGLFLGYFFYWSGSIWVPILMHFVNNASAVIAYYLFHNGYSSTPMEDFGASTHSVYWIISLIISALLLFYGKRLYDNRFSTE